MTERTPAAVARRFLEDYAREDVTAMAAACAADARFDYVPLGDAGQGRIAQDAVPVWQSYVDAFENFRPEMVDVWEDPARRTALAATINRGVHVRDVDGIAAQGRATRDVTPQPTR